MATFKRLKELNTWRLARELKLRVYAILARSYVRRDREFCDQIRESARSAPRNIAEGFGRRRPREFSRFLMIALGSLRETQNHLQDAFDLHDIDRSELSALITLSSRAINAAAHLTEYLDTCPDRSPDRQHDRSPKRKPKPANPKPETSRPRNPDPKKENTSEREEEL